VLLWGRGSRAEAAAGLGDKLRQPRLVVHATRVLGRPVSFEEIVPAADAALVTPRGQVPTLPTALVMAAGVPVVGSGNAALSELMAGGQTVWAVPGAAPRALAQSVLDVRRDPHRATAIAAAAAARVRDLFALEPFLDAHRRLYGSAAPGV
jgi:glycosyltransferase involved in cell wall biosynthesis